MEFDSIDLKNYVIKYGRVKDKDINDIDLEINDIDLGIKIIDLGKGYEIQYREPNIFSNYLVFCKNEKDVLEVDLDNMDEVARLNKDIALHSNVFGLIEDLYEDFIRKENEEERKQRRIESKVREFLGS